MCWHGGRHRAGGTGKSIPRVSKARAEGKDKLKGGGLGGGIAVACAMGDSGGDVSGAAGAGSKVAHGTDAATGTVVGGGAGEGGGVASGLSKRKVKGVQGVDGVGEQGGVLPGVHKCKLKGEGGGDGLDEVCNAGRDRGDGVSDNVGVQHGEGHVKVAWGVTCDGNDCITMARVRRFKIRVLEVRGTRRLLSWMQFWSSTSRPCKGGEIVEGMSYTWCSPFDDAFGVAGGLALPCLRLYVVNS